MLAYCDMRTLYLRNVPDDVVDRLQRLAARDGISVNAVAVRELTTASRRIDNAALLAELPNLGLAGADIAHDVASARATR